MNNLTIAIIYDKKNHLRIIRSRLRDEVNPIRYIGSLEQIGIDHLLSSLNFALDL